MTEAFANLFEHLIRHDDTWVVQIHTDGAAQAPYLQGAANEDGSFTVEISNNDILDPPLTAMQVAGLQMHGFSAPAGEQRPNFFRDYAAESDARAAAELLATVLESVLLFGDSDAIEIEVFDSDLTEILTDNPELPLVE